MNFICGTITGKKAAILDCGKKGFKIDLAAIVLYLPGDCSLLHFHLNTLIFISYNKYKVLKTGRLQSLIAAILN